MKRSILKIFLIIMCVIMSSGCATVYNPATGRKEMVVMDDKVEVRWGQSMAEQFKSQYPLVHDKDVLERVNRIGRQVAAASHRNYLQYRFHVIDMDVQNAFAVPGGFIFIYKGLLDQLNDDELAFVLSHEVGHVCARHSVKKLIPNVGATLLTAILFHEENQEDARKSAQDLYNIFAMGYSRSDEYQADSLGVEGMIKAGFDPDGALSLFKKFETIESERSRQGKEISYYLRTHPFPDQRAKNVVKFIKELRQSDAGKKNK